MVTKTSSTRGAAQDAIDAGAGILRLEPCWVPRTFMIPGRRLRLHPDDLYALGAHRGGINERWFSSTTHASNGPGTPDDEGLSYVRTENGARVLFKSLVDEGGDLLLGASTMQREGGWNLLCKFFDNMGAIPHHLHQSDAFAKLVDQKGKPEAYYFPPQYNQIENAFPFTFMGLEPGTTKDDVRRCLENWSKGDNGILFLSRAYRLQPGTGWQINPGILHAPGSLVTYEPQVNSDVFAMFQSLVDGRVVDRSLLTKDVRPEYHNDLDYLVSMLDWEANVNPEFAKSNRVFPRPVHGAESRRGRISRAVGVLRHAVVLGEGADGDAAANRDDKGCGRVRAHPDPGSRHDRPASRIDAGDDPLRRDDRRRALRHRRRRREGVRIENLSDAEPLVILKHFGPGNPDNPHLADAEAQRRKISMTAHTKPALHNAMWPGLVGKGPDSEPPIDLDTMLDLTAAANVDGVRFDGVDLFLFDPHVDIDSDRETLKRLADRIRARGFVVGSLVAPVWPPTGGGSAMGGDEERKRFLTQVRKACAIGKTLRELGIRRYGVVRIDSAASPADWAKDPAGNTKRIAETFREACAIADDHGERLAAEGEICWGGMHSWKRMLELLEMVGPPAARSAFRPTWRTRCCSRWAATRPRIAFCPKATTGPIATRSIARSRR